MITINNRFFPLRNAACFVIEGGLILFSVVGSFLILNEQGLVKFLGLEDAIIRGLAVVFFCQSCMYVLDLYDLNLSHTWGELFFSVVFAVGFFCIGVGLITYVFPFFGMESRMYYLTVLFTVSLLMAWRTAFYYYIFHIAPPVTVLIVGSGRIARNVANEIEARKRMGFQTVGLVAANLESGIQQGSGHRIFAGYDSIIDVVKQHKVTDLVVAIEDRRGEYPTRQMLQLRVRGCRIVEWQAFLEKLSGRIPVENLAPSFFIFSQGFNKSPIVQWARRCISFLIALFGLVALAPFMIVVAILIRSGSSGKVFYMQERVGLNGKPFMLIKFRSMRQNSEQGTGPQWAMENDPRITSVGKWIRKYRIDEIPQLINVLMGDLDLIGPRPERPVFVEKLEGAIPYYAMRHTVRPGVTGWAQVMFPYCGSVEESKEKLQYDLYYIKNMSIKLDLLIIIRTVKILILGRGSR